jgi:hypothetical protein
MCPAYHQLLSINALREFLTATALTAEVKGLLRAILNIVITVWAMAQLLPRVL